SVGQYLTASATDPQGDTSEFSLNVAVSPGDEPSPTPTVGPSATPSAMPSPSATPTATASPSPTASPTSTSVPGANLVRNPSFEAGVDDWYGWHSTLARVAGGQDGSWAARVTAACTCAADSIDDSPNTVADPKQGQVYTATAWVKAGSPS